MTIKNIGIFAHVDAGKTTLTEQLLYQTGAIRHLGRVDHGTTQTDSLALERERGISIISMPTSYTYQGQKVNIIDTPGHVDFIAEVERSMLVLDGAILVISAKEGVQSHTKLLFNALKRMAVPTLLFVNKVDRMGVEVAKVLAEIHKHLTPALCVLQTVYGEGSKQAQVQAVPLEPTDALLELLAQVDEAILVDYLEGAALSQARLGQTLQQAVAARVLYPVLFGSALNGIGIPEMLAGIQQWLPAFEPLATDEPSGVVFKIMHQHGKKGRTCVIKLTAGQVFLRGFIGADRVTGLSRWQHGQVEAVPVLQAGDIGMVIGLHQLKVGNTFGQGTHHKGFALGKPTLKVKIQAERLLQRPELLEALTVMADNDPYLSYQLNEFNDDIYITLFGYVQMEIVQEMLKRDYGIESHMTDPMTIYMETPCQMAEAAVTMHQDGLPYHAAVGFRVEPLPKGSGIVYRSAVPTGHLQQTFQNAVADGVYAYLDQGLYGWELTDMQITLNSYEYDSVTSTPRDYRELSPLVLFEALKKAGTKLLWPLGDYRLVVPTLHMGRAMADLRQMKATMEEPVLEGDLCTLTGIIPVDLCPNYQMAVHQYTSGIGYFESKVTGYADAPAEITKERPRFKRDPANRGTYLLGLVKTP
ncbi:MAG: TetM/TetW/TetO/TetS family tetracycline resistance ribosomal protection protein [Caldilineaceae bacterium]|nr:TetM/TetW/TetO/TetS family tetracycline resistance ribosomal protection protein [Caldilineaceae bacterium]